MRIDIDKLLEHSGESKLSDLYTPEDIQKQLNNAVIDIDKEYGKDNFIMQFIEAAGIKKDIMSTGNISVSVGGAKSRKTFFASMLISAFTSDNDEFAMRGDLQGKKVLLIDTEQSKFHVQKVARRIKRITKKNINNDIDVLAFREVPDPKMRLAMLDVYLSQHKNEYSFVLVDGIVDMVNDYNNQEECRKVVGLLMSWSSIYNLHINNIIHTNKNQEYARGHLGAELINKSETAFRITKEEGDTTNVKCEASRNAPFDEFDFSVNDKGLPERVSYPSGYEQNIIAQPIPTPIENKHFLDEPF